MKISNLSKTLLVFLLIVMAYGAYTVKQILNERNQIVAKKDYLYDSLRIQYADERKRAGREKLVLVRRVDSLDAILKVRTKSLDSLGKELTKIPKRYDNKTSKELAELLEQRANGN